MADAVGTGSKYENFLNRRKVELEVELARVQADAKRIALELDVVKQSLSECSDANKNIGVGEIPVHAGSAALDDDLVQSPGNGSFGGLTLSEAATKYLTTQKDIQSVGKVSAVLTDGGFVFTSGHPTRALGMALLKRARSHGDVFRVGNGLWGHTSNFTPARITKLTKKNGGMGGRSHDEHGDLTKVGMKQAQAAGTKVGAKSKLNADNVAKLKRLIRTGYRKSTACREIGITIQTYYHNQAQIDAWTEGEQWPPPNIPRKGDALPADPQPQLKVVK